MRKLMNPGTYPAEEEIRNARLARGLRALAATLIVGGIVIAALDNGIPSSRAKRGEAPVGQFNSDGRVAPRVGPAADVPAARTPDTREGGNGGGVPRALTTGVR